MVNFRWTGYNALILLAAMQAVNRATTTRPPPSTARAPSASSGASRSRRCKPTLIFVIITATIGGLQIFDEPRMFDQTGRGGAGQQWLTITLYLYNIGWGEWNFGRAAALAWILFLIILVIGVDQPAHHPYASSVTRAARGASVQRRSPQGEEGMPRMSAISTPPIAMVEETSRTPKRRRNRTTSRSAASAPASGSYAVLGVVVLVGVFPLYWSFLIGSGDASSHQRPEHVVAARRQLHRQRRVGRRTTRR